MIREKTKVIIGAGSQTYDGWISTHKEQLDLTDSDSFRTWFQGAQADAFLCEHVFEHLTYEEARTAARICHQYLRPGGFIRVAVPDKFFPNTEYQNIVRIGGPGPADHPAADHKMLYDMDTLRSVFKEAGFEVKPLEYFGPDGVFHFHDWDYSEAPVYRSIRGDKRNHTGKLVFTSIIIDAVKT